MTAYHRQGIMNEKTCYGKDCDRKVHSKGLCSSHYGMMQRKGHVSDALGYRGKRGWLTQALKDASTSTSAECIKVTMPSRDRIVCKFRGKQMHAARAVYILAHGDPGVAHVLHTCGNGHAGCINIQHLYAGDHPQNMRDKVVDDTSARGSRNVFAKLDEIRVQEARLMILGGARDREVAAKHKVSRAAINLMRNGKTWGWLPWPQEPTTEAPSMDGYDEPTTGSEQGM